MRSYVRSPTLTACAVLRVRFVFARFVVVRPGFVRRLAAVLESVERR